MAEVAAHEELDDELEPESAEIPSGLDDDEDGEPAPVSAESDTDDETPATEGAEGDENVEVAEPPAEGEEPAAESAEGEEEVEDEPEVELEEEAYAPLDGAVRYKGQGVFIPEGTAFDRLEAALNGATRYQQELGERDSEIAELRETRSAEADVAADVLELVFKDFGAMTEDELYEWAVAFKQNLPTLRADIREKHLARREEELERRASRPATATRAPAAAETAPAMTREQALMVARDAVAPTLEQLYARPELAGLTASDKKVLTERIGANVEQYIRVATDDSLAAAGVKKGEAYLDAQAMLDRAKERAEVRTEERGRQTVADRIARMNARKLGRGAAKVATGAAGGRTGASEGTGEYTPPKDRQEWLRRMEAD